MLIVVVILCILAVIVCRIAEDKDWESTLFISVAGAVTFGIIALIIVITIGTNGYDMFVIDDKIELYEEENQNIEKEITTIVNNYQGYEKDIISGIADMETIVIKIPELKSSELVKTQMQLYVDNNNKIKELKERKINTKVYKWLLYFGK